MGRWLPSKRVGPIGDFSYNLKGKIKAIIAKHIDNPVKLVCTMACGKVSSCPFSAQMIAEAREAWLDSLAESLQKINDPDWRIMDAAPSSFTKGVQVGSKEVSLPRTPAVSERKVKWRKLERLTQTTVRLFRPVSEWFADSMHAMHMERQWEPYRSSSMHYGYARLP
jgi:hypothetical protein